MRKFFFFDLFDDIDKNRSQRYVNTKPFGGIGHIGHEKTRFARKPMVALIHFTVENKRGSNIDIKMHEQRIFRLQSTQYAELHFADHTGNDIFLQ